MTLRERLARWWSGEAKAERTLLAICRGDAEQMRRLVEHELELQPGLERVSAIRRAIRRYRQHNR